MKACAHCHATLPDAATRCLACSVRVDKERVGDIFRTTDQPLGPAFGSGQLLAVLCFVVLLLTAAVVYLFY